MDTAIRQLTDKILMGSSSISRSACISLHVLLLVQGLTGDALFHGSFMALGDSHNDKMVYKREGTVNFGGVFSIHEYDDKAPCGTSLREPGVVQHIEAMVYAIDHINAGNDCLEPSCHIKMSHISNSLRRFNKAVPFCNTNFLRYEVTLTCYKCTTR